MYKYTSDIFHYSVDASNCAVQYKTKQYVTIILLNYF